MLQSLGLKMINEYKDDTVFYYMWYPTVVKGVCNILSFLLVPSEIFFFIPCVCYVLYFNTSQCLWQKSHKDFVSEFG